MWGRPPFDSEQRTVWVVRLLTHFTACLMLHTGQASHPFLSTNRKMMVLSFVLFSICGASEEARAFWGLPNFYGLQTIITITYKLGEALVAFIVLSGCFIINSLLEKTAYELTSVFYLSLTLYGAAILTHNLIKIGYLGNAVVSACSFSVMRSFRRALPDSDQAATITSLIYLEAVLVISNVATFIFSLRFDCWGLKAAVYALYIYRVTLVFLLIRPFLREPAPPNNEPSLTYLSDKT